jgi:flagellar hook-associated protein 3 FlgL
VSAGSFTIGSTPADTASNLNSALSSSINTVADTSLVASSAIEAGDNFFNTDSIAVGNVASTATTPVNATTTLSGTGTDSLSSGFAAGDTLTVNGSTIAFYNSSTTPPTAAGSAANTTYVDLATATVGDLTSDIDSITGTTTASTVSGGEVTLNDSAGDVTVTSSNAAALAALGLGTSGSVSTTGGTVTGSAVNTSSVPISGATSLSGAAGTNSLSTSFAAGDTIDVDGSTIQFYNSNGTPPTQAGSTYGTTYVDLATATVGDLTADIDKITGTSTPSTVSGGVVTIHTDDASTLNITSSNPAALQALGFSSSPITAIQPPLRVNGSPLGSATSLTSGASDTVQWYTGNTASGSARDSMSAQIDTSETVDYGAQANEQAIRQQLQNIAVFAAFKTDTSDPNANAQINDLSQSIVTNLDPPSGQQTIADIQTAFSNAQTQIQAASARQTQTTSMMQDLIAQTEQVSPDQVSSELLAVQNSLTASYEATSMLSKLTLTNYLSPG